LCFAPSGSAAAAAPAAPPFDEDAEEDALDAELRDIAFDEGDYAAGCASDGVAPDSLPPLPAAALLDAFDVWSSRATRGIAVLSARDGQRDRYLGGTGFEVSIMAGMCAGAGGSPPTPEVCFVYWRSTLDKTGRKIELDEDNKAKWPTSAVYPLYSFVDYTTVTPVSGCNVNKSKTNRTPMPATMMLLRDMWQSGLNTASGDIMVVSPCWACEIDVDSAVVFECALCLCSWHPNCAHDVLAGRDDAIDARQPVRGVEVPHTIAATLCPLCALWLRRDSAHAFAR
jgi:hypothetical protein